MKPIYLLLILSSIVFHGCGQKSSFNNTDEFTEWMTFYYLNPDKETLSDAFEYGVSNSEIREAGSTFLVWSFFAGIFRQDPIITSKVYKELGNSKSRDVRLGIVSSLWLANKDYCIEMINNCRDLERNKEDILLIDSLLLSQPFNIFTDPIKDPSHLDMCWADFFATGNKEAVIKIVSGLKKLGSNDYYENQIGEAARWSLRANAYQHKKVYQILSELSDKELQSILEEVDEKKNE